MSQNQIDWKKKYIKYKIKYIALKKSFETKQNYNVFGGGKDNEEDINEENEKKIFTKLVENNLEKKIWDSKSLLLDCIAQTQMQTETVKLIKWVIANEIAKPSQMQLDMCLTYSVFCGYYTIANNLIKLGANPQITYNDETLVDIALKFHFYKTAKVLMNNGAISKEFYNQTQMVQDQYNFSNDPENFVGERSDEMKRISDQVVALFKEKLLSKSKYNFQNLSRNSVKEKLNKNIVITK